MYANHFGLRELPFNNTPDPRFFYPTPDHEEALATLIYAVGEGKGYVLLTGEVGTGKTLISRLMLRHFDGQVAFATVNHAVESAHDLLHLICTELEVDVRGDESNARLIHSLQTFLLDRFAARMPVVLVLDEAQNLPRDAFELLRTIGNLESDEAKLLQVVILGQPELRARFQAADMRQLRQRLFRTFHLPALSPEQCGAYIRHRLQVAGATADIFDESAVAAVHHHAGGLPRLINTICDNALLSAYSADRTTVDGPFVESVLRQMMPIDGGIPGTSAPAGRIGQAPEQTCAWPAATVQGTETGPTASIHDARYVLVPAEEWQAALTRLNEISRLQAAHADAQRSATVATASGLDEVANKLASLEQEMAGVQERTAQGTATANAAARQVNHLQKYVAEGGRRYEQAVEKLVPKAAEHDQRISRLESLARALRVARQAAGDAFAQAVGIPDLSIPDAMDAALLSVPAVAASSAPALRPDERVGQLMQRIAETERQIDNIEAWLSGAIRRGDAQAVAIQNLQGATGRARRLARKAFERATRAHRRVSSLTDEMTALKTVSDRMATAQKSILAQLGVMNQSTNRARRMADEAMKEAVKTAGRSKRIGDEVGKVVRQIEQVGPADHVRTRTDRLGRSARRDTNERLRLILERSRTSLGDMRETANESDSSASAAVNTTASEALARDLTHLAGMLNS